MDSPENTPPKIPLRAGRFFTKKQIEKFTGNCKNERKAEFFSKDLLQQLLDIDGCDGLRIYYGEAPENEKGQIEGQGECSTQPRLFIVPVTVEVGDGDRLKGRERVFTVRVDKGKDGEDEFGGIGQGAPMPPFGQ
jgi:hypothetical protein